MFAKIEHGDSMTAVYGLYSAYETSDGTVKLLWHDDVNSDTHTISEIPDATITSVVDLHGKARNDIAVDLNSDAQNPEVDTVLISYTTQFPTLQEITEHHIEEIDGFEESVTVFGLDSY